MSGVVHVERRGSASVLLLAGRVDAHVAPGLRSAVERRVPAGEHVEADLSRVSFLDHDALLALRLARERCRSTGGDLRLTSLSRTARAIMEATALGRDLLPEQVDARARSGEVGA